MAELKELSGKLRAARQARRGGDGAAPPPVVAAGDLEPAAPVAAPPLPLPRPTTDSSEGTAAELERLRATHPLLAEQLARLDPWQLAAVLSPGRATLVRAHVGSGKTTVLAHKLLWLHFAAGVPLSQMAVLTFTNKAADELRERIRALCGAAPQPPAAFWLTGTFHGVARSLLAQVLPVERLGYRPDFAVIDEHERDALWERLIAGSGLRIKYRKQLAHRMELLARGGDGRCGRMKQPDDLARLAGLAHTEKQRRNLMDFDDLLDNCIALLPLGPPQPPLRWMLIDELQDCDERQLALVELLVGPDTGLFAVGDPNQAIYSWRGSDPTCFDRFRTRHGCVEHVLPRCYRCSATILDAARALIGAAAGQGLDGVRGPGGRITVRRHLDAFQEACYLAGRIAELVRGGVPYRELAVLYRTRRQAETLREVLARAGIPAEEAARRSLRELPALGWVVRLLRTCLDPLPESVVELLADARFGVRGEREKQRFSKKILEMSTWLAAGGPPRSGGELFERLGLQRRLRPTASSHTEDVALVRRLLDDLARRWLEGGLAPATGLRQGLDESVLGASPVLRWEIDAQQDSVKLMTLHAAKGLEFSHVFISGANEGLLPVAGSWADPQREAEERRLLFVGLTRARDGVEISWHLQPQGFGVRPEPSSYLRGLPRALVDWVDERPPGVGPLHAAAGPPAVAASALAPFTPGQAVRHPRYGPGTVLELGRGGTVRCLFPGFGERSFAASFCPLTAVDVPGT